MKQRGVPSARAPAHKIAGFKQAIFGLIAVLLFFGILEAILWAAGYPTLLQERDPFLGFSERMRVFTLDESRGCYVTPARAVAHSFNYQTFLAKKPSNGFRSFTLGGSAAYGFPWGAQKAFTRFLGDALQASWPGKKIEAVNAAAMSYGSNRLRILAKEVLRYDPDVLIFYEGHNEFIERRFYHEMLDRRQGLDAARQVLYRWRLYSLLTRGYERIRGKSGEAGRSGRPEGGTNAQLLGLDVVREDVKNVEGAERAEVLRQFDANLRAILEMARGTGARVVLCTVPSNLSRWAPNQSFFPGNLGADPRRAVTRLLGEAREALAKGDAAAAVPRLEKASSIAPDYAEVQYQLGRAYEALERWDDARAAYVRARDADGAPARATTAINDTIRRVAAQGGAILVDVEQAFVRASPHGLPGFDLFEDYVHPKPEGQRLIAFELWKTFQERGLVGPARPADEASFRKAVGAAERPESATNSEAPEAAAGARTPALMFNLGVVLENQGRLDQAVDAYRSCLARDPRYLAARDNLGRILLLRGQLAEAAGEFAKVIDVEPRDIRALVGLGESLRRQGRPNDALPVLDRAVESDPRSAVAWNVLGETLFQMNRPAEAETAHARAAALDPSNADTWAGLGFACLLQMKLDAAQTAFRNGLAQRPDHSPCRNGLAAVLTEKGKFDEAERLFSESLRSDPNDAGAREGLKILESRRSGRR